MSKFFYSENNYRQYRPTANWWQRFKKRKEIKNTRRQIDETVKLRNPFQPTESRTKQKVAIVILSLILVSWIAALLYHPFFKITNVQYTGFKVTDPAAAAIAIQEYFKQGAIFKHNIYFVANTDEIAKRVGAVIIADKVEVTKVFPSCLKVNVTERLSSIVFDNGEKYYLLDKDGNVIREVFKAASRTKIDDGTTSPLSISSTSTSSTNDVSTTSVSIHVPRQSDLENEYSNYPILYSTMSPGKILAPGENILSTNLVTAGRYIYDELLRRGIGKVQYMSLEKPIDGMKVVLGVKPMILVNPIKPLDYQIENIKMILEKFKPTEYVDVRFDDRLFWK